MSAEAIAMIEANKIQAEKQARFVVESFDVLGENESERLFTVLRDLFHLSLNGDSLVAVRESQIRDLAIENKAQRLIIDMLKVALRNTKMSNSMSAEYIESFEGKKVRLRCCFGSGFVDGIVTKAVWDVQGTDMYGKEYFHVEGWIIQPEDSIELLD